MSQYQYDTTFFDYVEISAASSAGALIAEIQRTFKPSSVLDVGCGRGIWVREWCNQGVSDVLGIDGAYLDQKSLAISPTAFQARDLAQSFRLGRRFELVQCLEVAEHIPEADSDTLLENLVAHGDVILFSAVTPGQGGEFHVNEQLPEYWLTKFHGLGYDAFDFLRPRIYTLRKIEPWYRDNTFLLANEQGRGRLPPEVLSTLVPAG
jgi:SAM-dependent methyltransferase